MSDRPKRVSHWLAVLREPGWKFFVAFPFTLLTVFATIREEFLPAELAKRLKLPAIIEDHVPAFLVAWPWHIWALITAFVLIWLILEGSYRVSAREADDKAALNARFNSLANDHAQLELIFDKSNSSFVKDDFYPFNDKPPKSRKWFVGIKNSATRTSADEVTVKAQGSWFTENTICGFISWES